MRNPLRDLIATTFYHRSGMWANCYKTEWLDQSAVDEITSSVAEAYAKTSSIEGRIQTIVEAFQEAHEKRWGSFSIKPKPEARA